MLKTIHMYWTMASSLTGRKPIVVIKPYYQKNDLLCKDPVGKNPNSDCHPFPLVFSTSSDFPCSALGCTFVGKCQRGLSLHYTRTHEPRNTIRQEPAQMKTKKSKKRKKSMCLTCGKKCKTQLGLLSHHRANPDCNPTFVIVQHDYNNT